LLFEVAYIGHGIAPEDLDRNFHPFEQSGEAWPLQRAPALALRLPANTSDFSVVISAWKGAPGEG
jgi:hypothetical protein